MTNIQLFAESFVKKIFHDISIAKISLMRMTFVQADYCYVCDQDNRITKEVTPDNILGRNRYGWICCDSCEKYVNIAKKMEEMGMNSLPRSITHHLTTENLKFWRKSSNPTIRPYIQMIAGLDDDTSNCIEWKPKYNTTCATISWPASLSPSQTQYLQGPLANYPSLTKCVPLCNIIYHNRNIFGYDSTCVVNKTLQRSQYINNNDWSLKWKSRFDDHYLNANGWLEFYKVCVRKNIPVSIINQILELWGMFQVESYYK